MIDLFALGLTHGLIALACWRILQRPDLDAAGDVLPPHAGRERPAARKLRDKRSRRRD